MPSYPEYVQITQGRRPVYYLTEDYSAEKPLPKKYRGEGFIWKKGKLWHVAEKRWILKNEYFRHQPRYIKINGQGIWNGTISRFTRNKLRDGLHAYFHPYVNKLSFIDIPLGYYLHIEYIFYFPFEARGTLALQDYFNHALPYQKTFEDTLVALGKLPSDAPAFIRGGYSRYVPVQFEGERRLEVLFHYRKQQERI
jgi:hypothetical protein